MSPPHFPITPRGLRGEWSFGAVAPGTFKAEGFTVEAREVPHKGGRTFGYRVSDGHSAVAYIPDHCPTALGPGPEGWGEYHPDALALAAGADLLIHDAFLRPDEVAAQASFGRHTPWGDEDSPALVTAVETALEQGLSVQLMHGAARPQISRLEPGAELVRQGDFGHDVYLILDGIIRVERDGERLAEYGPGAMLGERAALEAGTRTSTLVAVTKCRVASVPAVQLDLSDLAELSTGHRREEGVRG